MIAPKSSIMAKKQCKNCRKYQQYAARGLFFNKFFDEIHIYLLLGNRHYRINFLHVGF